MWGAARPSTFGDSNASFELDVLVRLAVFHNLRKIPTSWFPGTIIKLRWQLHMCLLVPSADD